VGLAEVYADLASAQRQLPDAARILVWDIETRPASANIFDLKQRGWISPDKVTDPGGVLGVAAHWLGSPEVMWRADWHDGGHTAVIEWVWGLLDEATTTITYNGDRFDARHMNREFVLAGLPRPKPSRSIDLLKLVRKRFMFLSNRLDYVAGQLGIGRKITHEGIGLWQACVAGDPDAQHRMGAYAKQDVRLTADLYMRLLPWMDGSANMALWSGSTIACSACGSRDLEPDGWVSTAQTRYAVYRCNGCQALTRTNFIRTRAVSRSPV